MTRYLVKRLGQSLLAIFLTVSTVFVLVRLAPGDPAKAYAGPFATTEQLEVRAAVRPRPASAGAVLGLPQGLVRGDLGTSFSFQAPAIDVVMDRLPYTLTLAVSAILVTTAVAVRRVWMAKRADTRRELGANVATIAGQSMPEFWTGTVLLTIFAVLIPVLPASSFATWGGLVLPTITIAIMQIALISRLLRREMVTNFAAPYLTVARSRGVRESLLTRRYAMRNASVPVVTALGTRFAAMLNGVVVVEVVFARGPASAR